MQIHDAVKLFPELNADEYAALRDDIKRNGQKAPIVVVDGKLVDGRHRLRACKELGIEPKVVEESGDPLTLVMSLNYHRRQLRPHEKGAALKAYLESKGGKAGRHKGGRPAKNGKPAGSRQVSVSSIAKELGMPRQTVQDQIKAAETYADLPKRIQAKVDSGECPIELAPKVSAAIERRTAKVMATATPASLREIDKIETEVNESQKRHHAAMKWLISIESGLRAHGEFIESERWLKAEKTRMRDIRKVALTLSRLLKRVSSPGVK